MKLNGKQLLDLVSRALTLSQRNASLYKWEGINANPIFHVSPKLLLFKEPNWLQFKGMLKNI